MTSFVALDI